MHIFKQVIHPSYFRLLLGDYCAKCVFSSENSEAQLMVRLDFQAIVQMVYIRRVLLAHRYMRKSRHQPAGTFPEPALNPRTIMAAHPYSISLSVRTDRTVRDSALELWLVLGMVYLCG